MIHALAIGGTDAGDAAASSFDEAASYVHPIALDE
jgi:hypothetical protein